MLAEYAGWMCRGQNPLTPTAMEEAGFYKIRHNYRGVAGVLYGANLTDAKRTELDQKMPEGVPRLGWAENKDVIIGKLKDKLAEGNEPYIVLVKHWPHAQRDEKIMFVEEYVGEQNKEEVKPRASEIPWITDGIWLFTVWPIGELVS